MQKISQAVSVAVIFLGIIWGVYVINLILPFDLRQFGITPRSFHGLLGILFAPFLHSNFMHISANSVALFALLAIAFTFDYASMFLVIILIMGIGGGGTWLFGSPNTIHLGASGLILGLIGYLLFCGWYHKDLKSIVVSILVFFLYGGALFSLLVFVPGISWTMHFFGFIGGICAAKITKEY